MGTFIQDHKTLLSILDAMSRDEKDTGVDYRDRLFSFPP